MHLARAFLIRHLERARAWLIGSAWPRTEGRGYVDMQLDHRQAPRS